MPAAKYFWPIAPLGEVLLDTFITDLSPPDTGLMLALSVVVMFIVDVCIDQFNNETQRRRVEIQDAYETATSSLVE